MAKKTRFVNTGKGYLIIEKGEDWIDVRFVDDDETCRFGYSTYTNSHKKASVKALHKVSSVFYDLAMELEKTIL